jgi:putative lipoprotein
MNRISPTLFIFLLLFVLVIDAYVSDVPPLLSEAPQAEAVELAPTCATLDGTVTYHQIAPLSSDARLLVLLKQVSAADGQEVVLGGHTIALAGNEVPLAFSVPYNPDTASPDGVYVIEARIMSGGEFVYETQNRPTVTLQSDGPVELMLARVTPWTPLEVALSSGRLSRYSVPPPWQPRTEHTSALSSR